MLIWPAKIKPFLQKDLSLKVLASAHAQFDFYYIFWPFYLLFTWRYGFHLTDLSWDGLGCGWQDAKKSNYRLTSIWYEGHAYQWTSLISSGTKVYRHNRICVNFKVWKLDVYITWICKLAQNVAVSAWGHWDLESPSCLESVNIIIFP